MAFNFILMQLVLLIKQIHLTTLQPPRPWAGEGQKKGYYAQQKEKRRKWWLHGTFFVAIAYDKGVILCKQYHGTLTSEVCQVLFSTNFWKK